MSKKSKKLWTTVTEALGQAIEGKAQELMISETDLVRLALAEYIKQYPPKANVQLEQQTVNP